MSTTAVDRGGNEVERVLLECFTLLQRTLSEHRHELEPYQERNAIKALAALRQIASGLDTEPPYLYDIETPQTERP